MSILLLSGGVDSAVLLASEVSNGRFPKCISFRYGQKHVKELLSADSLARYYKVDITEVQLPEMLFRHGSALTDGGLVPKGYNHEHPIQKITVVPNRNMVFLSVAAAMACCQKENVVLFAAHAGDAKVYPDCRLEFVQAIDKITQLTCSVSVQAPFLSLQKKDIVALGRKLDVPFELTWTCYEGGWYPCGDCGACLERKEAGL